MRALRFSESAFSRGGVLIQCVPARLCELRGARPVILHSSAREGSTVNGL